MDESEKRAIDTKKAEQEAAEVMQSVKTSRIILPILLGVGVTFYLLSKQYDPAEFAKIQWTQHTLIWLLIAFGILAFRHFAYMSRLYILTEGQFSWRKCFELVFIWEFSSAVTPTSIGGSALAFFFISQEKISAAKTATIVTYTIILDSIFFLMGLPILYAFFGEEVVPSDDAKFFGSLGAQLVLLITYSAMLFYAFLFIWGIFINPKSIKKFLLFFCKIPFLKRFTPKAEKLGDDILLTSKEVRNKSWKYHIGAFLATVGAWTGKFLLIIAIIIALVPDFRADLMLLILFFAKLKTMFILILLFPSPGGAGFVELAFGAFMHGYIPKTSSVIIATIWRLMAYYSYVLAGVIILPNWIKNVLNNRKKN